MVEVENLGRCKSKTVIISLKNGMMIEGKVFSTEARGGFKHGNEAEIGIENAKLLWEETPKIKIPSTIIINIDDISMYGILDKEFETPASRL